MSTNRLSPCGADERSWRDRLAAVRLWQARIERERMRAADARAAVLAEAVDLHLAERGGGPTAAVRAVAEELGVTPKSIFLARARAAGIGRRSADTVGGPFQDTLERLYAAELAELAPAPAEWWSMLAQVVSGIAFDPLWIENQPGVLLADEVRDAALDLPDPTAARDLAAVCAGWSRATTLAVIDALLRAPASGEHGAAGHADAGHSGSGGSGTGAADPLEADAPTDWSAWGLPVTAAPSPDPSAAARTEPSRAAS